MQKKTYFASDFHLGTDARLTSQERERQIVRWLDQMALDAEQLFLVGDIWEFWVEYKSVVPKGSVRLLGKLAELRDGGLNIEFFTGNHDLWMGRYFEDELGILTHRQPILREINGKSCFIGHGDGLGPGDSGYKFLKKIFTNPTCQWLFRAIHPDVGSALGQFWSGKSRVKNLTDDLLFLGEKEEWLIQFCEQQLSSFKPDYFIFGHRHLPIDWMLSNGKSRYINLGEWMRATTFAVLDETGISLQIFENESVEIYKNW
jgi:UDP-2,3-diacylglucosamine hydrolase